MATSYRPYEPDQVMLLTLRSPPVEACIALSILLVASEALHGRQTLARRWPALVAIWSLAAYWSWLRIGSIVA